MFWKIYFWFILLLVTVSYAVIFIGEPVVWDFIDVLISATAFLGLFAYAYRKAIFNQNIWKLCFVTLIFWDAVYNLILAQYLGVAQQFEGSEESTLIEMLVGFVLFLPEYMALFLLAFKARHIWADENITSQTEAE